MDFKLLDFVVSNLFRIWASICLRPKSLDVQSFFEMEQQRFLADCCFHHHALGKRPSRAAALAVGVVLFSRTLFFHPIPCRLQQHALLFYLTLQYNSDTLDARTLTSMHEHKPYPYGTLGACMLPSLKQINRHLVYSIPCNVHYHKIFHGSKSLLVREYYSFVSIKQIIWNGNGVHRSVQFFFL